MEKISFTFVDDIGISIFFIQIHALYWSLDLLEINLFFFLILKLSFKFISGMFYFSFFFIFHFTNAIIMDRFNLIVIFAWLFSIKPVICTWDALHLRNINAKYE